MRPDHSIDPALILKNKHGQLHRKFDTSLTNVMNSYALLTAPTVTWYADGDADRIRSLLEPVQFIGKRRASGFGRVARWEIEPDDLDGIEGPFGEPLRPVPVDMFRATNRTPLSMPRGGRPIGIRCTAPPVTRRSRRNHAHVLQ